jgi:hypothetical protein
MVNKLITEVKKQNERDYNKKGYKIVMVDVKVDENRQSYILTLRDKNFTENTFMCDDVNSLYNLLKDFGFDSLLEVK